MCLTFADDCPAKVANRRLNSFFTNVIRPACHSYVRFVGRTTKGRLHYHVLLVMANYYGRRRSGSERLRTFRKTIRQRARKHGFGITHVSTVRDVEGYSVYMAQHVDRARFTDDVNVKRVSYSSNFVRTCFPRFSWNTAFSKRWRNGVAAIAKKYDYSPNYPRKWVWQHYREIIEGIKTGAFGETDSQLYPRVVTWRGPDERGNDAPAVWTVLRFAEDADIYALQRETVGDERFNVGQPIDRSRILYRTITHLVSRRDLQRIVNAQPA